MAFLLLASSAWAQARRIEATAKEVLTDSKRPAFVCEGTTTLPETGRLDAKVYFGEVEVGRHLDSSALEVREGKFRFTFPVFSEKTLAGSYVVCVEFNPYLQQQKVQDELGRDLRHYEVQVPLVVGTERDAVTDRRRVFGQLGDEIQILRGIAEKACASPPDNRRKREWNEQIRAIEKRSFNVPEYRALRLDDISEQFLEDLAQLVHHLLEVADDEEARKEHRKRIEDLVRPVALRLGLEKASSAELAEKLPEARKPVIQAAELYRSTRKNPTVDAKEYYKAQMALHRKKFQEVTLAMTEVAPEKFQEGIRSLMQKGMDLFRAAQEAREFEDDRSDALRELAEHFRREADAFESALKEPP